MTYEEYLDEVTTLMVEKYALSDAAAIKLVMKAQAADFFTLHDEQSELRTEPRAHQDAKTLYEKSKVAAPRRGASS